MKGGNNWEVGSNNTRQAVFIYDVSAYEWRFGI